MNTQHFGESVSDLWNSALKPFGAWIRDTSVRFGGWCGERFTDATTPHGRGKALEVIERSFESMIMVVAIIAEAVLGERNKNARWISPWHGFDWSGPVELNLFTGNMPDTCIGSVTPCCHSNQPTPPKSDPF